MSNQLLGTLRARLRISGEMAGLCSHIRMGFPWLLNPAEVPAPHLKVPTPESGPFRGRCSDAHLALCGTVTGSWGPGCATRCDATRVVIFTG
ncbi:hypothetical protein GCM10012275_25180 [Longimycelium tulufanense]|uniref:Uncharacterized protein n=1 Tax=Longimycelium tulufanense TaxID=907463 RepID=A0A8J3FWH4_9PSEU|nr:hypothetical protein GCM10012275_25180 [Longimycelium tulufanense]